MYKKKLLQIIAVALIMFSVSANALTGDAKGELAGKLGFVALVLDTYYELCYSGVRTDNYLNGVNKLLQKKWGFDYTEISFNGEKQSGRNIRQEAHTLIHYKIKEFQSCNSVGMKEWLRFVETTHKNNLIFFHSIR